MIGVIDPARKDKVAKRASAPFKPSQDAGAGGNQELELDRPTGLLRNDDCSRTNPTTTDKVADLDFDDVAKFSTINWKVSRGRLWTWGSSAGSAPGSAASMWSKPAPREWRLLGSCDQRAYGRAQS